MEQAQRQEEVQRLQTQVQQLQAERQQEVKKVESQVQELTARLQEREEQITEAADCYEKLNAIYLADKADAATVLAATVLLLAPVLCMFIKLTESGSSRMVRRALGLVGCVRALGDTV